jgi:hypothetical protein
MTSISTTSVPLLILVLISLAIMSLLPFAGAAAFIDRQPFWLYWIRLLKRVFDIDVEHCPNCGSALKIIAAIEDPPVIIKILSHLGLPTRAPARRVDLFQTILGAENRLPTQADGAARSEFERTAP